MDTQQQALLGILGGMGPLATVDFLGKLISMTPVTCDQEHLPWITFNQPGIPDRSAAIMAGNDGPLPFLTQGAAWLAAQGVKLIAIPCNTSHFWYKQIQAASSVPILHIVDATTEELQRRKRSGAIAILATRGTMQSDIYSSRLQTNGFDLIDIREDEQTLVDQIIKDVKRGQIDPAHDAMHVLLQALSMRGVKTAVLGCTELPIAHKKVNGELLNDVQIIDTSLALATVSLRRLGYL